MRKNLRIFSITACVLLTFGIYAQAQPTLVTELPSGSSNFVTAGDLVYFTSGDSLFRTNGTAGGTFLLRSGFTNAFTDFTEFNNMLFFIAGSGLWRSDGTPTGTVQLTTKSELQIFSGTGGILFFQGSDATTGRELYKTDGTPAGTMLVKDINPGAGSGFTAFIDEEDNPIINGEFYFRGNQGNGGALWKSDGTAAGTQMVKAVNPLRGSFYPVGGPLTHNDLLYFSASTGTYGQEPWVSDGTPAGTFMIKDVVPGADAPGMIHYGIGHNGTVYFITMPPRDQWENESAPHSLWKTSGTSGTTVEIAKLGDIRSSFDDPFRIYRNKVYFFLRAASGPHNLFVTDGTAGGTQLVFNLQNYEGFPKMNYFDVVNDYLVFHGTADGYPTPFFRSDGTTAGTQEFARFNSGGYLVHPRELTEVGDFIFYGDHDGPGFEGAVSDPADYFHLMQSDGVVTASMRARYGVATVGTDNITGYNGIVVFTTQNDHFESQDRRKYLWTYDPSSSGNEQPGTIQQEIWSNVSGTRVSSIPLTSVPSSVKDLTAFEIPTNVADNYGSRVRGFVMAPETGNYTFWIASDDQSQLWLSTDEDPANKRKIAEVTGWTTPRQWEKYASQKSAAVSLTAGKKYYIEVLHKEGPGGDNLAVGWQLPRGTMERPIPGKRLYPFEPSTPPPACAGTGTISLQTWVGIDGTRVSSIPVDSPPDFTGERNIFEAPSNVGNNFGTRARGYVCVPVTGNYTFWIASDDQGELWLSTDANPANKRRIAYHTGWTWSREWSKYATQRSAPISLVAGQQYYIEALYKENEGGDNMAVGWQLPDGTLERPIPGNRLSPFNAEQTMAMQSETTSMETTDPESNLYSNISIYPNPARSGDAALTISGYEGIDRTIETQVEIINITGEVVFAERIACGGNCSSYLVNVNKQLVPGMYVVNMSTNGVRSSKRLFVK